MLTKNVDAAGALVFSELGFLTNTSPDDEPDMVTSAGLRWHTII